MGVVGFPNELDEFRDEWGIERLRDEHHIEVLGARFFPEPRFAVDHLPRHTADNNVARRIFGEPARELCQAGNGVF